MEAAAGRQALSALWMLWICCRRCRSLFLVVLVVIVLAQPLPVPWVELLLVEAKALPHSALLRSCCAVMKKLMCTKWV